MQRLKTRFCNTCSLQPSPENFPNKKTFCQEDLYPSFRFYSYDKFMLTYFPNEPQTSSKCDAIFIGKESILFIEQKTINYFEDYDQKKANALRKKYEDSIERWKKIFPINSDLKHLFLIVFSKTYARKKPRIYSKTILKDFIRKKILTKKPKINLKVFCCDELEKEFLSA